LTSPLYHINVSHMKTASIRDLKHDTSTVLSWVEMGDRVEICKRGKPVAIMIRPDAKQQSSQRPDFLARLKSIYGDRILPSTATDLLAEERGDR